MKPLLGVPIHFGPAVWLNATCAAMTAALGLAGWLVAIAMQNQLDQAAQLREGGLALLQRTAELHAGHQMLQNQTSSIRELVESLRARLPNSADETTFLRQLSELATSSSVALSDYRPGSFVEHAACKELDVHVCGTGPYAGVCRFLDGLGKLPRMVRVSQMTIVGPNEADGDCTIDLQLYLLFEQASSGKDESMVKS